MPLASTSLVATTMSERARLTINDAEAAASSLTSLFCGSSAQESLTSAPQEVTAMQRSVPSESVAPIPQVSQQQVLMSSQAAQSIAPSVEEELSRILAACSQETLARLGFSRLAASPPLATSPAAATPVSPPAAATAIASPLPPRPSTPPASPVAAGVASATAQHDFIENVKRLVRDEVARKAWPDDLNSFSWVNGVKYRASLGVCVADLKCSFQGCTARRTLTVAVSNPSSYSWTLKPHGDHPVHITKKRPTDPEVKKRAAAAASCGGTPAKIASKLFVEAREKNKGEGSGPLLAHQTMTTKQIQNLKYRSEDAKMPPARGFEQLVRHYQSEVHGAMVVPFRIPIIATWTKDLLGRVELQFYIDSTFELVLDGHLLTPLLVALPLPTPGRPAAIGPVVPVAFYVHAGRTADDYAYFLSALKRACNNRVRVACWHRDYDDAITNAIAEVCSKFLFYFACYCLPYVQVFPDAKQCGDSWHFKNAINKWLHRNGFIDDDAARIRSDVNALLLAPSGSDFTSLSAKYFADWKKWPAFRNYFDSEWVRNNKWTSWALHARNLGFDTGDQKGEAYNGYLQQVVFGGVDKNALHVVMARLHSELQDVDALLRSPDLLKARIQSYESCQP